QVFVRTVHRVTGLERRHGFPAFSVEQGAGFGRRHVNTGVFFWKFALRKHFNRASKIDIALLHHHFNAWVLQVGRFKYSLAFAGFVDAVDLAHAHGAHDLTRLFGDQGDFGAVGTGVGRCLAHSLGDRHRPEQAFAHGHGVAYALPIRFAD